MSIKIGIRIRPLNDQEEDEKCLQKVTQNTLIMKKKNQKMIFDDIFEDLNGNNQEQQKVWKSVGQQLCEEAWVGYNSTIIAFGQTGSGKSYTINGFKNQRGILYRMISQIFEDKSKKQSQGEINISVQMMELYNEKIFDLLIPHNKRQENSLQIRMKDDKTFFVQNLSKIAVEDEQQMHKIIDLGWVNRSVASTSMNINSSRSHCIIQFEIQQIEADKDGNKIIKTSMINLVDLAGSENLDKTQTEGQTKVESLNINKSLFFLCNVIQALEQKSKLIPYNESKLTKILKNSLGGNSKTYILCTVSPSESHFYQTQSTLNFATRAKQIQNKAFVNISHENTKELSQQYQQNMQQYLQLKNTIKNINLNDENLRFTIMAIQKNMEKFSNLDFESSTKQQAEELIEQYKIQNDLDKQAPYIYNLSEDQFLTGKWKIHMKYDDLTIGQLGDLVLNGEGIADKHAMIFYNEDNQKYYLQQLSSEDNLTFLNGRLVNMPEPLQPKDCIVFGRQKGFIFETQQNLDNSLEEWEEFQELLKRSQRLYDKFKAMDSTNDESDDEVIIQQIPQKNLGQGAQSKLKEIQQEIQNQEEFYMKQIEKSQKELQELKKQEDQIQNDLQKAQSSPPSSALKFSALKNKKHLNDLLQKQEQLQNEILSQENNLRSIQQEKDKALQSLNELIKNMNTRQTVQQIKESKLPTMEEEYKYDDSRFFTCVLCLDSKQLQHQVNLVCKQTSAICKQCFFMYLVDQIENWKYDYQQIFCKCINDDCSQQIHYSHKILYEILGMSRMELIETRWQNNNSQGKNCFMCPGCSYPINVSILHENKKSIICPNKKCKVLACLSCHKQYQGITCCKQQIDKEIIDLIIAQQAAICPFPDCGAIISKTQGCNHMKCKCNRYFSYCCSVLNDPIQYHGRQFHRQGCAHYTIDTHVTQRFTLSCYGCKQQNIGAYERKQCMNPISMDEFYEILRQGPIENETWADFIKALNFGRFTIQERQQIREIRNDFNAKNQYRRLQPRQPGTNSANTVGDARINAMQRRINYLEHRVQQFLDPELVRKRLKFVKGLQLKRIEELEEENKDLKKRLKKRFGKKRKMKPKIVKNEIAIQTEQENQLQVIKL